MLTEDIFDHRVNRLISAGRAFLAIVALFASSLDPGQFSTRLYVLLAVYTAYAVVVAVLQWLGRLASQAWGGVTHFVDVLIFVTLVYLTDGPTSPFFPFLVFALLSASLRWQWRGAMWTTLVLLLLFVSMGLGAFPAIAASAVELQRFLIRSAHLTVVGGMLSFFFFYHERITRDLMRINTSALEPAGDEATPIPATLRYVMSVYRADRGIFAWSDAEEPWLFVTVWEAGKLREDAIPPDRFEPLIRGPLARRPFVYRRGRDAWYRSDAGRLALQAGPTINSAFVEHYGVERAVVLPVTAEGAEGWLLVLDARAHAHDALIIAEQLAGRIVSAFDRAAVMAATAKARETERQLRLARDLHDGVLQFLAGLAMQLEGIVNGVHDPAERRNRLRVLQDALAAEQRELRTFIRRLRPGPSAAPNSGLALQPDLAALVERLENQWRVNIHLSVHPGTLEVPAAMHYDLHQLVREAVANAVRHGRARWINVTANRDGDFLHLTIADDGNGLGHHGTFEAPQLIELGIGPRTLRERTQALGGTIIVTSASLGAMVCMSLPLKKQEALRA